jgi:multisubunit Na+/H+ antiporter MnhG subunit
MHFQLTTPRNRKWLITYGVLLILIQPAFTIAHYAWNEAVKPYPWYTDSIAIPIFSEILFWLLLAPFAILTIVRATRNYRTRLSVFENQTLSRKFLGPNIVFGLLICYALLQLFDVFTYANIPMLLDVLMSVYLLLAVRAIVIANWHQQKEK